MESLEKSLQCLKGLIRPIERALRKGVADSFEARAREQESKRKATLLQTASHLFKPK